MALNIQRLNFDPVTGDNASEAFMKLDLDIGEIAQAIDGDGAPGTGIDGRLAAVETVVDGLGDAASMDVGTGAGTVAAGNDGRFDIGRFKNKLLNGDGRINNRRFAGGALASGVFGYDRWKAASSGTGVACNAGLWTLNGSMMQTHELDTANPITGKAVTISLSDPSGPVTVQLVGTTTAAGVIPAGSGQRSVTLTVPASSGPGIACTLTTSASTTFRNIQMEVGSIATGFESRSLTDEELLCARYCPAFRSTSILGIIGTGQGASATQTTPVLLFRVTPRVPPTGVVVSSATHFAVSQANTANTNCTSITFGSASLYGAVLVTGGSSGLVAGNQSLFFFNNAAGWLYFEGCDF